MGFSPDGTELYAAATIRTPNAATRRLRGWSMETGRPLFDVPLGGQFISGPQAAVGAPLPGPEPGTLIPPPRHEVVDTRAGLVHHGPAFTRARWAGRARLLGSGPYAGAPHLPLPREMPLPEKDKLGPGQNYDTLLRMAMNNPAFQAAYVTPFDREEFAK